MGIEYDERIFRAALSNRESAAAGGRTLFALGRAEDCPLPPEADRIFFFNPFSEEILRKVMTRIRELGWESRGYTFHSLRHAHALHYYQAGADLFQVQQRLRHRSITSTLIYVQLDAKLRERRHVENPFDDPAYPGY